MRCRQIRSFGFALSDVQRKGQRPCFVESTERNSTLGLPVLQRENTTEEGNNRLQSSGPQQVKKIQNRGLRNYQQADPYPTPPRGFIKKCRFFDSKLSLSNIIFQPCSRFVSAILAHCVKREMVLKTLLPGEEQTISLNTRSFRVSQIVQDSAPITAHPRSLDRAPGAPRTISTHSSKLRFLMFDKGAV